MEQRGRSGASWLQGVCHQSTITAAVENKELKDHIYTKKESLQVPSYGTALSVRCLLVV